MPLHRTKLVWLCALLAASGCQCFSPVDEDAGVDASVNPPFDSGVVTHVDAGADAGTFDAGTFDAGLPGDGGCVALSDCFSRPIPTEAGCTTPPPDGGWSCIQNKCVWECPLEVRVCTVDQGSYCLVCGSGDAGTTCPTTTNCNTVGMTTATVERGASCTGFTDVTITRGASAQCRYFVNTNTSASGEIWRMDFVGYEYIAYFPSLGGWCTGHSLSTGAPRSIINCPDCQFVLMGWE
jgi:hypothetical protein